MTDVWVPVDPRAVDLIDLSTMRGLEIGALHNPRVPPHHPNTYFLDHASADELRQKYAANPTMAEHVDDIVDVDFVWQPGLTLREVVGDSAPFDFVVASHVVEHIPNPIGWLRDLADILTPDGVVSLVVPDKRFCFDARRETTRVAQWVDADLRGLERPSFEQIYDHEVNYVEVDTVALWQETFDLGPSRTDVADPDRFAFERCLAARDTDEYVDVHCSTFTPESFVELIDGVARLGLLPFRIARLFPTVPGSFEFHVTLQRCSADLDVEARILEGTRALTSQVLPADLRPPVDGDAPSRLEWRLLRAKRAAMAAVRDLAHRVRHLGHRPA